jgi:hypothetical protein
MPEKKAPNRMAEVIRKAIIDKDIMQCLTSEDLSAVLSHAVEKLTPSDVQRFIYRCISNREIGKGLIMADRAIDFALERRARGENDAFMEIVGAAVGSLSMLSVSLPAVKDKITTLLAHPHPDIVVAVIENLGHTSNLDNFNRVADLLLQPNPQISAAAMAYVEACARDAAFRKRQTFHVIERSAEEFLRSALLRLEKIYQQVSTDIEQPEALARRLAIIVALMYNELLDSTDWKRFKREEVDERIYYALEQHLQEKIGPDALPYLFRLLTAPEIETGIKRSALHTFGRLCKQRPLRSQIVAWLPTFIEQTSSDTLRSLATCIAQACEEEKPFSVLMFLPDSQSASGGSIVPGAAGAPLCRNEDVLPE